MTDHDAKMKALSCLKYTSVPWPVETEDRKVGGLPQKGWVVLESVWLICVVACNFIDPLTEGGAVFYLAIMGFMILTFRLGVWQALEFESEESESQQ